MQLTLLIVVGVILFAYLRNRFNPNWEAEIQAKQIIHEQQRKAKLQTLRKELSRLEETVVERAEYKMRHNSMRGYKPYEEHLTAIVNTKKIQDTYLPIEPQIEKLKDEIHDLTLVDRFKEWNNERTYERN